MKRFHLFSDNPKSPSKYRLTVNSKQLLIVTIALLLCGSKVSAHDFEVDGIYYNITSEEDLTVEVTRNNDLYNSYWGQTVTIPSCVVYESVEYSVTSIGSFAFSMCSRLTSISIPESVTSIGSSAFSSCSSLTSITLPEGMTSIGKSAFHGCSSLTSITLPEGMTSIGSSAFSSCSSLTSITLPEGMTSIGNSAFYGCSSLTYVTIPESVTSIGESAFYETEWYNNQADGVLYAGNVLYKYKGLMYDNTSIEVKEGTTGIAGGAFMDCSGLTSITIPKSVISIGTSAFSRCSSLTSITIPEGVTSIESYAFVYCGSLTSITIPESVTSIGDEAFYGCSGLTSITLPEGLTSIGESAFRMCSLTSITIPESVTSIGESAFYSCSSLTSIAVAESNSVYDSRNGCNALILTSSNTLIQGCSTTIVPESVTSIGKSAFRSSRLTSITLPESVTSIGESAFGSSSLTSITLPEGLTSIGDNAFNGCKRLTSITLPESVTSIGESAFYGCESLTSINIPKGVTSIKNATFRSCGLTSITLPEGLTSIGESAFYSCESLTSITLLEGVKSIGASAFWNCYNLTSIVLPKSLETVGEQAFASCSKLLNVYCYAESIPSIESDVFVSSNITKAILRVPADALDSYKTTTPWKNFGTILPFGVYITGIELSQSSATLIEGETLSLGITLTPEDSDINLITWSSSNPSVATVDNQGKVKAVSYGTATIIATAIDGGEASDSCEVTVDYADYVITYLVDGEVYATDTIARTSAVTPLADPVKEGYTFSGWSEIPETMPANDVTVSGSFTINKYLVNFALDGVVISSNFLEYGTAIVAPEVAEREGYTFGGWQNLPETVPASDITINGNFTLNRYTITYVVEEEVYHTDTIAFGSQITAVKYPVKEGYSFDGWSETPEFMPAGDMIITGTFSINSYKITYTVDGETLHADSIEYGDTIVVVAEPVKEGYTFSGWGEIPMTMPAKDVAVNGSFTINKYQITYMVGEDVFRTDSIAYGTYITSIKNPVREGYTFDGWEDIPEKMPARDVITIGLFSINKYKVTYTADNVTIYTDSIVYGGEIKDINAPTKEGYSFGGWEKGYQTMPAFDIVVNGTFTINKYQISYVVGGETIHTDSITYNERITPIDNPEKEGFNFSGWIGVPGIMPAYDVTVGGEFYIKNMQTDKQGLKYELNEETETFELSNYEGMLAGTIVIPSDLYGYPVNGIKDRALMGAEDLVSVIIPENITSVGYRVFYGCNNISYIEWETTAPVEAKCFDEPARHGNLLVYVKDTTTKVTYQGNVIIDGVAENITISDEQPLRNIREFKARNISFTREFTKKTKIGVSGGWEAMIVPFDVQRIVSKEKGELKLFGEADFTTSLPYWLGELQEDGTFATTNSIKANKPFIMQLPNSDEYRDIYNVEGEVTFSATDVTVFPTTDMEQEVGNGYVMLGSYEGTTADSHVYALNDEEYTADGATYMPGSIFVANSRDIRPFEAYVYTTNAGRAPYLRVGKETTGVVLSTVNGQQTTEIYDLTGRKVLNTENLKGGVYIVNGRKIVVK